MSRNKDVKTAPSGVQYREPRTLMSDPMVKAQMDLMAEVKASIRPASRNARITRLESQAKWLEMLLEIESHISTAIAKSTANPQQWGHELFGDGWEAGLNWTLTLVREMREWEQEHGEEV